MATRNEVRIFERYVEILDVDKGDKVRIIRTCADHAKGWGNVWNANMTKNVGKIGVIPRRGEMGMSGVVVAVDGTTFSYPPWCLEKV